MEGDKTNLTLINFVLLVYFVLIYITILISFRSSANIPIACRVCLEYSVIQKQFKTDWMDINGS